ncbi:hypothetical protein ACOSP7_012390 [Xanthoceras sorbifolium]
MEPEEIARRCANLSLTDEDGPIAKVKDDVRMEGMRRPSLSLVGKLISNRKVNREAFKNTIASIWRVKREVSIESIGVNLKRVLEGGSWSFDKNLLVLKEAVGIRRVADVNFTLAHFWVQIYNLPLASMNKKMGEFLGGLIGEFLRVRVLIDVLKPLKRGLRFMFGDNGEECSVLLRYERLPNFCYFCGKMGHLLRECRDNEKEVVEGAALKYGVWLRAPSGRPRFVRNERAETDDNSF